MFEIDLFQTFYSFNKLLLQIKKSLKMLSIVNKYDKLLSKTIEIPKNMAYKNAWYKGFSDI